MQFWHAIKVQPFSDLTAEEVPGAVECLNGLFLFWFGLAYM